MVHPTAEARRDERIVGASRREYGPWAIVAGASEGVGRELARKVAANGVNCILIARREEAAGRAGRADPGREWRRVHPREHRPGDAGRIRPDPRDRGVSRGGAVHQQRGGGSQRVAFPRPRDRDLGRARQSQRADHDAMLPPFRRADARTTPRWAASRGFGRGLWWGRRSWRSTRARRHSTCASASLSGPSCAPSASTCCRSCSSRRTRRRCATSCREGPARAVPDGFRGPRGRGRSGAAAAGPGLQLGAARQVSRGLAPHARPGGRRAQQEGVRPRSIRKECIDDASSRAVDHGKRGPAIGDRDRRESRARAGGLLRVVTRQGRTRRR